MRAGPQAVEMCVRRERADQTGEVQPVALRSIVQADLAASADMGDEPFGKGGVIGGPHAIVQHEGPLLARQDGQRRQERRDPDPARHHHERCVIHGGGSGCAAATSGPPAPRRGGRARRDGSTAAGPPRAARRSCRRTDRPGRRRGSTASTPTPETCKSRSRAGGEGRQLPAVLVAQHDLADTPRPDGPISVTTRLTRWMLRAVTRRPPLSGRQVGSRRPRRSWR